MFYNALNRKITDRLFRVCGCLGSVVRRMRLSVQLLHCPASNLDCAEALVGQMSRNSRFSWEFAEREQRLQSLIWQLDSKEKELTTINREMQASLGEQATLREVSDLFLNRIGQCLQAAQTTTESAVLSIGLQVSSLYETAHRDNQLASDNLIEVVGRGARSDQDQGSLAEVILQQERSIAEFVGRSKSYFERQYQGAVNARDACVLMQDCVAQVDQLVFSSELLSFNVRCEAIRLGNDGSPFAVLAEEMGRFTQAIKSANLAINKSLANLSQRMKTYHDESVVMKGQIDRFAGQLSEQMEQVQEQTETLSHSLRRTLEHMSDSNAGLMKASQQALSELQFQDPLAQDLKRTLHETHKLRQLIQDGIVSDTHLNEIDPTVGSGLVPEQEPGVVELF